MSNEEDVVEEEENVRQASGGSILPDSQALFLTLEPVPSQDQLEAERDAGEGTSAETLSVSTFSTPGQIRRWKKKALEDLFNVLMHASNSDKMELRAWRITLSENLDLDRTACREKECVTQDEMLRIMKEQSDMLRHLAKVQERQLDAKVPLQPMLNRLPSSPISTSSSPKHPAGSEWGGVWYPSHSTPVFDRQNCNKKKPNRIEPSVLGLLLRQNQLWGDQGGDTLHM
ncbi:uncharacterized protein LOC122458492 [Dermochelys coriacea]|uniref:uncharacterized protein LOC122458492 n=1 Tax=Dermochelys coriacea TaxID=27794 RepID=UPI001CA96697|nr:uncharacterized protein LOC122458492 [Dermochelys coriacea]